MMGCELNMNASATLATMSVADSKFFVQFFVDCLTDGEFGHGWGLK